MLTKTENDILDVCEDVILKSVKELQKKPIPLELTECESLQLLVGTVDRISRMRTNNEFSTQTFSQSDKSVGTSST